MSPELAKALQTGKRSLPEWVGSTPDAKVPPRVRLRIFEREGGRCWLSGRKIMPGEPWELDHKIALCNGGDMPRPTWPRPWSPHTARRPAPTWVSRPRLIGSAKSISAHGRSPSASFKAAASRQGGIKPQQCQRPKPSEADFTRQNIGFLLRLQQSGGLYIMGAMTRQADELPLNVPQSNVMKADGASLMEVISRAASDPATDVDKLERLLGLYERITGRQAEQAFHEAMQQAQSELRPVAADASNPQTKSKYASYPALDRAVRPIYVKHGLSLSFDTGDGAPADHLRLLCHVAHRDGFSRTYHVDMPADGKGAKGGDVMTKTHATGAALSYGQRYLLKLIFNIAVGDDDDGNSNGGREQSAAVSAAITSINACADLPALAEWKRKNAAILQALPPADADTIVRVCNMRARKMKEAQS